MKRVTGGFATAGLLSSASAADLLAGALQGAEGPEVLDLELGGRAGHLAGLGVEGEVRLDGLGCRRYLSNTPFSTASV